MFDIKIDLMIEEKTPEDLMAPYWVVIRSMKQKKSKRYTDKKLTPPHRLFRSAHHARAQFAGRGLRAEPNIFPNHFLPFFAPK